jgi:hypothetical protein
LGSFEQTAVLQVDLIITMLACQVKAEKTATRFFAMSQKHMDDCSKNLPISNTLAIDLIQCSIKNDFDFCSKIKNDQGRISWVEYKT